MKKTLVAIVMMLAAIPMMAQQYDVNNWGATPANWVKNQFAELSASDPGVASKFEALADDYWVGPAGQVWKSPDPSVTGWGRTGLSYFSISAFLDTYRDLLGSGVYFSPDQVARFEGIWVDGLTQLRNGTFWYYGPCNGYNGTVNKNNSCGEDDASIIRAIALGWTTFPESTNTVMSDDEMLALMNKFFDKLTSTDYVHGGDLMTDGIHVWMPNHGGPSVVYSLLTLIEIHEAQMAFIESGKTPPDFLKSDVLLSMFHWAEEHVYPDGSAFTSDCYLNSNPANATLPCNDPNTANAVPTIIPAGNYVDSNWGDEGFLPGSFHFTTCDSSLVGKQGNFDAGRYQEYCRWNPGRMDFQLLPAYSTPPYLDLKWIVPDSLSTATFDVWNGTFGQGSRVVAGLSDDIWTFPNAQCSGQFGYTVYAVLEGRIVGYDWGSVYIGCSSVPRRHIQPLRPPTGRQ